MIWIVVKEQGEYSDYGWSAQQAFTVEADAKAYAEKMRTRHIVFQKIAQRVQEWENAYKAEHPQPTADWEALPDLSKGDREILQTSAVELKEMRKAIQKKREVERNAHREKMDKLSQSHHAEMLVWYAAENAAKLDFIRKNFSKELAEFEISEDKLMGYTNWYYEPEWNVYSIPLDNEERKVKNV